MRHHRRPPACHPLLPLRHMLCAPTTGAACAAGRAPRPGKNRVSVFKMAEPGPEYVPRSLPLFKFYVQSYHHPRRPPNLPSRCASQSAGAGGARGPRVVRDDSAALRPGGAPRARSAAPRGGRTAVSAEVSPICRRSAGAGGGGCVASAASGVSCAACIPPHMRRCVCGMADGRRQTAVPPRYVRLQQSLGERGHRDGTPRARALARSRAPYACRHNHVHVCVRAQQDGATAMGRAVERARHFSACARVQPLSARPIRGVFVPVRAF